MLRVLRNARFHDVKIGYFIGNFITLQQTDNGTHKIS